MFTTVTHRRRPVRHVISLLMACLITLSAASVLFGNLPVQAEHTVEEDGHKVVKDFKIIDIDASDKDIIEYRMEDMVGIDHDDNAAYYRPFSAVKHIDRAVALCIGQWLSSEGMPKHQTLGLASGYTEVVKHWEWTDQNEPNEDVLNAIHEEAIRKEAEYEK